MKDEVTETRSLRRIFPKDREQIIDYNLAIWFSISMAYESYTRPVLPVTLKSEMLNPSTIAIAEQ